SPTPTDRSPRGPTSRGAAKRPGPQRPGLLASWIYQPPRSPALGGRFELKRRRRAWTDSRLTPSFRAGRGRKGSAGRRPVVAGVCFGGRTTEVFSTTGALSCRPDHEFWMIVGGSLRPTLHPVNV